MGYEVIYHYYERNEDGPGYNVADTKQMKRKIGSPHDDVPYEKLAGAIMAQMARRDVMVTDVEVFEFTKKKVCFKETKGGVVIGSRKYSFDDCGGLGFAELTEETPALPAPVAQVPALGATRKGTVAAPLQVSQAVLDEGGNVGDLLYFQKHRPIREEMFAPKDKVIAAMAKSRKMPFTIGSMYQIYEEKMAPGGYIAGMLYTVRDDTGGRNVVSDKFFDTVPKLFAGELFDDNPLANLDPSEPAEADMPDVSRMRR